MAKLIDKYGIIQGHDGFNAFERPAYQVDQATSGVIYMRYQSGTGKVVLIKLTTANGVTTRENAFDTWENRASAAYIPCNDPLEVE